MPLNPPDGYKILSPAAILQHLVDIIFFYKITTVISRGKGIKYSCYLSKLAVPAP